MSIKGSKIISEKPLVPWTMLKEMEKFLLCTVTVYSRAGGDLLCSITPLGYSCRGREKGLTIQAYQLEYGGTVASIAGFVPSQGIEEFNLFCSRWCTNLQKLAVSVLNAGG